MESAVMMTTTLVAAFSYSGGGVVLQWHSSTPKALCFIFVV